MTELLERYIRFADGLSERVGTAVSWLTSLLVLVVCLNVASRYLLGESRLALQELSWHLFGAIFLMGAGFALKHDRHVRVDVLYAGLSRRTRGWIDLVGTVLFLVPFCVLGIWVSLDFVVNAWSVGETSPDPGGLPWRWIPKALIPGGLLLLLLQGLGEGAKAGLALAGRRPFEPDELAEHQY